MLQDTRIRPIEARDNAALAAIIRSALKEFNANKPGTVYFDETTDRLSDVFSLPNSCYYVAEEGDRVLGGSGIYPTSGLDAETCELVKMYLVPEARGKGLSKVLMDKCIAFAANAGFKNIYLETMPELSAAVSIYGKMGFTRLPYPLGNSGHSGCNIWMLKSIDK